MTPSQHTLWIGTYPPDGADPGSGEGVWQVTVDAQGCFGAPRRVVETPSPSFLALHPSGHTLFAVAEAEEGAVTAFTVGDDGATLSDPVTVGSGGASPAHLLALADALWIANYADGVASVVPLDPATGALVAEAPTCFAGEGTGPREDRQEGPHAHFTGVVGERALVADLGADLLRAYPADPGAAAARAAAEVAAALPPGSGPRHFVVLPGGALVVTGELDGRLHVLAPAGPDTWEPALALRSTVGEYALSQLSHVTLTGDLVLVGVRGADLLAVHRVTDAAATAGPTVAPTLAPLADIPLGAGAWPRHHAVVGEVERGRLLAVVALQGTNQLASVLVDTATGQGAVASTLSLPTPAMCVLEAS